MTIDFLFFLLLLLFYLVAVLRSFGLIWSICQKNYGEKIMGYLGKRVRRMVYV